MRRNQKNQGGQALLMVTMGLFAMCGLMGLAIDLGWSFYVHKTAQAAADSAALGAAKAAFELVTVKTTAFTCDTKGITCQPGLADCGMFPDDPTNNLSVGCQFAKQNGFTSGGNGTRQTLRIEANAPVSACSQASPPNCIPTAPGVAAFYWVHVVATETIPQLFSAIYGNTNAVVSADATAAIANIVVPGSVYATNRLPSESFLFEGLGPSNSAGVDIALSNGSQINAPGGGIFLASNCPGSPACGNIGGNQMAGAGQQIDSVRVNGITYLRAGGDAAWCGNNPCQKGAPSSMFGDPYSGLGQPPIHPAKTYIPVIGGTITTAICGGDCPPGNYYAVDVKNKATGMPVHIGNGVTFNGGNFGTFVFMGGVATNGAVNLGPGEYVAAGVNPALGNGNFDVNQGGNAIAINLTSGGVTGGNGSDAGRLFISTNLLNPDLSSVVSYMNGVGSNVVWNSGSFKFGEVSMPSNMANSWYGLNPDSSSLPDDLKPFGPLAFWQDQQNSKVEYDVNGNVMNSTSCNGDGGDAACMRNNPADPAFRQVSGHTNEPQFNVFKEQSPASTGNLNIHGVIYQPRGGSMKMGADVIFNSDSTLVSGTIDLGGPGTILNLPRASRIPLTVLRPVMVH